MIFVLELGVLFFLSKKLTKLIFRNLYRLTKNRERSIYLMALIFLPGTFLHEVSHFITALFLLVRVGELDLIPEVEDGGVKMGSVAIGKSDFLRRFLIGIAPILVGLTVIFGALNYVSTHNLQYNPLVIVGLFYLLFQIGNTMFSSKRDMEGVLYLVVFLVFLVVIVYLLGLRISITEVFGFIDNNLLSIFRLGSIYMFLALVVDLLAIFILNLF